MGSSTARIAARSVLALGLSFAVAGCSAGSDTPASDYANGTGSSSSSLSVVGGSTEIYCDNTDRLVGEVRGATPGEQIVLTSPQPIRLSTEQRNAVADADGTYRLMWRCSPTEAGQPWELRVEGQVSGRRADVSFVGTAVDPDRVDTLAITLFDERFVCDGRSKELGQLADAAPLEPVTFAADRADDLVDGEADREGRVALTWQCSPSEAGTWEVTARGLESDRIGEFTIVGVAPDDLPTPTVEVEEDPFACDGASRVFATVSGFLPEEVVAFTSPQSPSLMNGRADERGDTPIRWTCGAADAEMTWELTATGDLSERTVTFLVTGAPAPLAPDPTLTMTEDPFRCDGSTRYFATITGFAPREFVDFESPQADAISQGQADADGAILLRWTCDPNDSGTVWNVTATGATSARSIKFQIRGASPLD